MRKTLPLIERVQVEKLVYGGQALAHALDKSLFLWNALPGECIDVAVTRKNSKMMEGVGTAIHTPSVLRQAPQEEHWLSCSPWQIISSTVEQEYKMTAAREAYAHVGVDASTLRYQESDLQYGYRNKIEWSFALNDAGLPALAFFGRGSHIKHAVESCVLSSPTITQVSRDIVEWIREQQIPLRSLKSLIVRSNGRGEAIAGLFLKDHLSYDVYPQLNTVLRGFHVYYSSHKSPASVVHGVLHTSGDTEIAQDVLGTSLLHGLHGFFQVNVPVFESAVVAIDEALPRDMPIIDLYGGVGSIGIPLASRRKQPVTIIESNAESTACAMNNSQRNDVGATVHTGEAEKLIEHIAGDAALIVDPPRSGLHEKVIARMLEAQPQTIAYLSCNISTQARDIQLLSSRYTVTDLSLYNFFPRTPHIEGLSILKRR